MSQALTKIINGKVITPGGMVESGSVVLSDGIIQSMGAGDLPAPGARTFNARGMYVSPGFIDLHVHGGGGFDFMDGHESAFLAIAETHARFGTTAMLPTTLTGSGEEILHTIATYERALPKNTQGAQFLGMHLEGPYFAMNQRGAQDPRYIRDPDPAEYRKILEKAHLIRRWSAAPELKGAIAFAHEAREKGVLVSMAHTDAIYEEALEGFNNGYTLATHLYSGMSGVTRRNAYRYAGVVEAAFLIDGMDVEIIADGVHLPAPLLQLVYKIKGAARTALITDAMRAAGMPEGDSVLGNIHHGLKVLVEDGVAKLPDRSAFAGSVATADRLVRTMIRKAGVTLPEAVRMMTATPASILGLGDRKGALAPGMDADIVIFDQDINVHATIIKGEWVYENK
ncbi:N-acetylglucosamine-6-phosphate deacetylase [Flavitalea sp. BT771]|uniref:N-acetylglucosamine-6-phosphate deacetylase n=1 Tax=Flavitalea sp. BT771 TaxID=3063329 RepID=UPI0026E211DA|nr:N-acetylglucosamine-6-phosphate deacetylase [Flavitalea sp. BT771]MDO6430802.1 N-acetylglucosamine-6-phosphate deacetylase [Flavitalea sp. BT771]MDV6219058.1 N-acetylglucosamine-6-phosphate deacetylase [Flavitalea sp. BT771]